MSYVLALQLTPAKKSSAAVLRCVGAQGFLMTVRTPAKGTAGAELGVGGSVFYEIGVGAGDAPQWDGNARLVTPGTLSRVLGLDAIRVWSAAADAPQFVQIEAD
jgi:hypothetical protein